MANKKIKCFLIYKIEKKSCGSKSSRRYKVAGLQATVHATSKIAALKLLNDKFSGISLFVIANTECEPSKLAKGDHCNHNLIIKDDNDITPLGCILPNSPEWTRRMGLIHYSKSIPKSRQEKIARVQKRKDIFD